MSSLHLDIEPGDREADWGGIMEPVEVWVRKNEEWAIIHRCRNCGHLSSNRVAADDNPKNHFTVRIGNCLYVHKGKVDKWLSNQVIE